jgi:hypothetical protein
MGRRSPYIPRIVVLTPHDDVDVDVEVVCEYLRRGGHFRTVGVEPDGSIEISTAERKPGNAKELVASCLDDEDRPKFIIGEPPW